MANAQISWFIKENGNTVPYDEFYAGTYGPNEVMEVHIQIWNNRWGQTAVNDAAGLKLAMMFENIEDNSLLKLCQIKVGNGLFIAPTEEEDRFVLATDETISGASNNGAESNVNNYVDIVIKFGPIKNGIRNNLKNMIIMPDFESM